MGWINAIPWKAIPWGKILTLGAEAWISRRRREAERTRTTETDFRPAEAPAAEPQEPPTITGAAP